jgi:PAS domain S-box-containing protein
MSEETLIQGEQLFRSLIEYSTDSLLLLTTDGTITYASPATADLTGYASKELIGLNSVALLHPDDQPRLKEQLIYAARHAEKPFVLEYRLQRKDGRWHWIEGTITNLLHHPQVRAIVCKQYDISKYKQSFACEQAAREAAQTQAEQFAAIFEAMTDGVAVCDDQGCIIHTNAAFRTLFSLDEDASPVLLFPDERAKWAIPRDLDGELLPQDQWPLFRVLHGEHLSSQETISLICRSRSGQDLFLDVRGTPLRDTTGQIIGGVAVYRDVTERHLLEQQLQDSERKFRSIIDSNIVGVMVTDQDGHMYEVNGHLTQLLGYSREELVGGALRVKDVLAPQYHSVRTRSWKTLITHGSSLPEEKVYVNKNGTQIPTLVVATAINQVRDRALVMILDIADRKEAERRKDEFLSMVSHELRTPLTGIQGFLELAQLYVERLAQTSTEMNRLSGKLDAMLQQAQRQTEIEIRLVAELLDVSRIEMQKFEVHLRPCNLSAIVQQVVANQQVASTRTITLTLPTQPVVPVMADADRIQQALTNYLTNACKYSPSNQMIQVQVIVAGNMARVSVCDQGPGLTVEQQEHVWDRFYQTQHSSHCTPGGGLGLGLYIVRTIIAQHQGQVGVESSPGQGATFWFMLPLADEPTATSPA